MAAGLGQRFLKRFLADSKVPGSPTEGRPGGPLHPPQVSSGHRQGEGVRTFAALVAEATAEAEARSADGSSHGPSRHSTRLAIQQQDFLIKACGYTAETAQICVDLVTQSICVERLLGFALSQALSTFIFARLGTSSAQFWSNLGASKNGKLHVLVYLCCDSASVLVISL